MQLANETLNLNDFRTGLRVQAGNARYVLSNVGDTIILRLVEVGDGWTPNLLLTMPACNMVEIKPNKPLAV